MATARKVLLAFNRGIVSALGLARIDVERMSMSAEMQTNWMPRVLGSMMLRVGFKFISSTRNDLAARQIPFVFTADDLAQLEITDTRMRVRDSNDAVIVRPPVTAVVANGDFTTDLASWVDADEAGGISTWNSSSGGVLQLQGDGTGAAIRTQEVTVIQTGVEHALAIQVVLGAAVNVRIGSTVGGDEYVTETELGLGYHSLAFTPTGNFFIQLANVRSHQVHVTSINLEAAGDMLLTTPWLTADLNKLRWDQSGDVVFVSAEGYKQHKIERRAVRSWSVVEYQPEDGPFRLQNTSKTTISSNVLSNFVTLTASRDVFRSTHVGALFRLASNGQQVSSSLTAQNTFSDPIKVTGTEEGRIFGIVITGTFVATVTVQYSVGAIGAWIDLATTYTAPVSTNHDDGQDNQIIYYRIGIVTGDYTSGTVGVNLFFAGGSISGVARIRAVSSGISATADVLKDFGSVDATENWWEGAWSDFRNYPTAVKLFEGRLWWAGYDKIYGSVSDQFESFDDETVGDSGPIIRNIGSGPVQLIHWFMSLTRMLLGTAQNSANIAAVELNGNNPIAATSNSFDEPLTPTNFNLKIKAARGIFVDRSKQRLFEVQHENTLSSEGTVGFLPIDLSILTPDLNEVSITQIAVQIKPDIRVHCVRSDGTAGVLVYDRAEGVVCWIEVETISAVGRIEDVSITPGVVEDQVYYVVRRTINSVTRRYIEKWALESECQGGLMNLQADSFVTYDATPTKTPFTTQLLHLRDETVVVWADGADVGTHTVSATGGITLDVAASKVVAGLGYRARYKGSKLATIDGAGLTYKKKVDRLSLILRNTHYQGLTYGPDFNNLSDLPQVEDGVATAANTVWDSYDEENFPFGGIWDTDSRICLEANAPRPCTVLACIAEFEARG